MKVKFKKLVPEAELPKRSTDGSSGYDIKAIADAAVVDCDVGDTMSYYVEYSTGISMELPEGYEAQLRARSSISKTALYLCNGVGTIDSDYRGEIKLRFRVDAGVMEEAELQKKKATIYKKGEKIGQLVFQKVEHPEIEEVTDTSETERGDGGFGSTGN